MERKLICDIEDVVIVEVFEVVAVMVVEEDGKPLKIGTDEERDTACEESKVCFAKIRLSEIRK